MLCTMSPYISPGGCLVKAAFLAATHEVRLVQALPGWLCLVFSYGARHDLAPFARHAMGFDLVAGSDADKP